MCCVMRKTMSSFRNRDSYSWHFYAWILFSKSKKSTPLLLASITAERWFSEDVCILKIARKHRVFKVYTPANIFSKIGQQVMNLKLTTGVRDQKAAGSNPATSTRKTTDFKWNPVVFFWVLYMLVCFAGWNNGQFGSRSSIWQGKWQFSYVLRARKPLISKA